MTSERCIDLDDSTLRIADDLVRTKMDVDMGELGCVDSINSDHVFRIIGSEDRTESDACHMSDTCLTVTAVADSALFSTAEALDQDEEIVKRPYRGSTTTPSPSCVEMAREVIASSSLGILTLNQLYKGIAQQYPNAVNGFNNWKNSIRDAINRSNIFIRVSLGGSPQLSEDEQDLRLTAWSLRDDPKTRYLSRVGAVSKESRATGRTKFRNILPAMAKAENVITTLSHEEEGQTYKENKALSMYHVMLLNAGIQEKKNVIVAKARSARAKMVQSQITDADTKSQQSASMCDDIATGTAAIVHSCDRHLSERSTVAPDEKGPESPDTTTARKHYSGRSEQQPFFNFKYLPLPFPSCDEHDDFHYDNDGSSDHTSAAAYVDIGWKEHDDMFQDLDDVDSSLGTQQILPAHREEDLVVKMTPLLYLRPSLTGDYASALQESQDVVIA